MELIKEKEPTQLKYPVDWEMLNLGKSSVLKARIGWQGLTTAEYLDAGDYYLITGTDFKHGYIDWDNCVYVEKLRYDQDKNIQVKEDDVLVTKDGTIGKVAFVNNVPKKTTLNSGVFVIRPVHKSYYPRYFYYVLMSEHFKDFLGKLTAGSTISHLYQKDFVHYEFPLPPTLTEQKAIATALSDVDALITSLEQTITKKKAIKQGAMQQLLTGETRIKGYDNNIKTVDSIYGKIPIDWGIQSIGNVCKIFGRIGFRGYTVNDIVDEASGALSLSPSNIINNKINFKKGTFISWMKYHESPEIKIRKGDIVLVKTASVGKTAIIENLPHKITLNPQLVVIKNVKIDRYYLSYMMSYKIIQNQIITSVAGGVVPTLTQEQISGFTFPIPNSIQEQKAISNTLSDMDTEITQLETKKEKYQAIKQGMMQELLTGKTRLI
jgi:type I restriction enzyme S subunit